MIFSTLAGSGYNAMLRIKKCYVEKDIRTRNMSMSSNDCYFDLQHNGASLRKLHISIRLEQILIER